MRPETAKAILGVVLLLAGAILLLSLFNFSGPLGTLFSRWAAQLAGWSSALLAPLLIWFGVNLLRKRDLERNLIVGNLVLFISLAALLHVFAPGDKMAAAVAGEYGGLIGYGLQSTVSYAVGNAGSLLVFLAVLAIGGFTVLNRPLDDTDEGPQMPPQAPEPPLEGKPQPEEPIRPKEQPPRQSEPDFQPRVVDSAWEQPPLSLLNDESAEATPGDTEQASKIIEQTLSNFNISAKVENVNVGPAVTQYELTPDPGVKLNQITGLSPDLARALAAHPIRIEAPIPGKSTVGIEVPNQKPAMVRLHGLFSDKRWKQSGALPLAIGLDVSGRPIITDLAAMPHLLIAGATGSGKSVGINSILMSLLFTHSPKHLRLVMVDPKRVELTNYNDIPHLIAPVIVDPPKVVNALKWVTAEMDRRYRLFQEGRVKNIVEHNRQHKDDTLPYLVVVVDELADLMAVAGKSVEATIVRIAQLARATGIHLVIATQRPSTNIITGVIKANFPSRMAFTVTSGVDSRVILDMSGAEKLLGQGDMLFQSGSLPKPIRVQGAFVDTKEIKNLTDFLKGKGAPAYEESVTESPQRDGTEGGSEYSEGDDPLYEEAKTEVLRARKASASFLQRRLKVGYARAARLLDDMEENGVIGPGEGAKPRDILVDPEDM